MFDYIFCFAEKNHRLVSLSTHSTYPSDSIFTVLGFGRLLIERLIHHCFLLTSRPILMTRMIQAYFEMRFQTYYPIC